MERLPHWRAMERYDPDLLLKHESWREHLFERGVLPRKIKELLMLAMCAQARFVPGVKYHANYAMNQGATSQELFEVCALSIQTGGVPSYRESILAVEEVIAERQIRDPGA